MTDVRSQRLNAYRSVDATGHYLWTSPAGMVTLFKGLATHNTATANRLVSVYVNAGSSSQMVWAKDMATGEFAVVEMWTALNPGDRIAVVGGGADVLFWLSGAVLQGTPPVTPPVPTAVEVPLPLPASAPGSC